MKPTVITNQGAKAYEHSGDHYLEFFSKAGSIQSERGFYENTSDILTLFKNCWRAGDKAVCMQLLFWSRDCRGGAGNRSNFRMILNWLANESPEWVKSNLHLVPLHGRWDDLKALYETSCEQAALDFWMEGITSLNPNIFHLAAKWADRRDFKLRKALYLTPKAYRKLLVNKTGWVVEHNMCSGTWEKIPYNKVPSVAMARLQNAFKKHDLQRFSTYAYNVACGKEKVNTKALFPHDIIRSIKYGEGDDSFNNALFKNLPNYIEDSNAKIMSICDFSASMEGVRVSGQITAMDVCIGLGLYCGDKLGEHNAFYRKLIPFSTTSKLVSWNKLTFSQAVRQIPDGYVGSTNIQSALDVLLDSAIMWNVKPDDMVNTLLILSDMQFQEGTHDSDVTVIEQCMREWEQAGYKRPRIVYWNLQSYDNQPSSQHDENIAMISGFSPCILKNILKNEDISALKIMKQTIEKYKISCP